MPSALMDRAVGHEASPGGPIPVEPLLCRAFSPAGATIASTLEDLLRYAAWHLADPVPAPLREVHANVSHALGRSQAGERVWFIGDAESGVEGVRVLTGPEVRGTVCAESATAEARDRLRSVRGSGV
jgi:hypothetical protein